MEEQVAPYVARDEKPALPAPPGERGFVPRMRKNLFATPLDSVLTVLSAIFIVYVVTNLVEWAWFDAAFVGEDRTACLAEDGGHAGACWAFVANKFNLFMYGLYPNAEQWRVNLTFGLLAVLAAALLIPQVPFKRLMAFLLFGVFPFVGFVLLTGGELNLAGGAATFLLFLAAVGTLSIVAGGAPDSGRSRLLRVAAGLTALAFLILLAAALLDSGNVRFLGTQFSLLSQIAFVATIAAILSSLIVAFRSETDSRFALIASALTPIAFVLGLLFILTADFGLPPVRTNLWGGLMVTLVVAITGIAASLPFGVLLALGRRSDMPAVRLICIVFIEFWRGIPLITVLFMAAFMLPLFLPTGVNFDELLRALVGVAMFSSAYMAEVIRGGLQAIPKGQYEGADAMALTYWQKMRLIVLPQALTLVIPGIVNTFIGLFKDTSLVYIIGLADLLGAVRRGFSDPNWITPSTPATGLVFAAFIFWMFCFGMSRYSIYMERRLDTGHKS